MEKDLHKKPAHAGKSNPFKVPANYFEELPVKVQDRIHTQVSEGEPSGFWNIAKTQISLAFSLFLLVVAGYFAVKFIMDKAVTPEINQEMVAVVLEQQPGMIEDYALFDALDAETVEALNYENQTSAEYSEEIIDYLVDNDIDMDAIVDEL